jgi:hypothetical protein
LDFDETGASLLNGGPNPNPVNFVSGGGIQFYLPGIVTQGDVVISAPFDINTANPNGESDVLSFSNGPGLAGQVTGIMLLQSLFDTGDPLLPADVQTLQFATPFATLNETGTEAANGFTWTVPGATYNGISDGVLRTPEPSTLILGALGLLSLTALAYRRRRRSRLCAAGLMLVLLAFGANTKAFAQAGTPVASVPPYTLAFDETGASLLNGGPNPNPVSFVIGGGIEFYLPGMVTPGDVVILAPFDISSTHPHGESDVLSFFDPGDPLLPADVQTLQFARPFSTLLETGTEAANGFTWTVPGATYNGISDGVLRTPEPSTFILGGLGLLCMAALAYRRRRKSLTQARFN